MSKNYSLKHYQKILIFNFLFGFSTSVMASDVITPVFFIIWLGFPIIIISFIAIGLRLGLQGKNYKKSINVIFVLILAILNAPFFALFLWDNFLNFNDLSFPPSCYSTFTESDCIFVIISYILYGLLMVALIYLCYHLWTGKGFKKIKPLNWLKI